LYFLGHLLKLFVVSSKLINFEKNKIKSYVHWFWKLFAKPIFILHITSSILSQVRHVNSTLVYYQLMVFGIHFFFHVEKLNINNLNKPSKHEPTLDYV